MVWRSPYRLIIAAPTSLADGPADRFRPHRPGGDLQIPLEPV